MIEYYYGASLIGYTNLNWKIIAWVAVRKYSPVELWANYKCDSNQQHEPEWRKQ